MATAPSPTLVDLAELSSGVASLESHILAGKILSPQTRSSSTDPYIFSFASITGIRSSVKVEIRGEQVAPWAQTALEKDVKVALLGAGGRLKVSEGEGGGKRRVTVVFEHGVSGWILEKDGTAKNENKFTRSNGTLLAQQLFCPRLY
jgi:hypothetical protein